MEGFQWQQLYYTRPFERDRLLVQLVLGGSRIASLLRKEQRSKFGKRFPSVFLLQKCLCDGLRNVTVPGELCQAHIGKP